MTYKEIFEMGADKLFKYHHTALALGYVTVKAEEGVFNAYSGKFGRGITIDYHNPRSSRYLIRNYYTIDAVPYYRYVTRTDYGVTITVESFHIGDDYFVAVFNMSGEIITLTKYLQVDNAFMELLQYMD